MFHRTTEPPPIQITEVGAPTPPLRTGFRLWERAVLCAAPLAATVPLACCLAAGRAGFGFLGLAAAAPTVLTVVARRIRRDAAPEVPTPPPGWSATWSDFDGTVVQGQRAA